MSTKRARGTAPGKLQERTQTDPRSLTDLFRNRVDQRRRTHDAALAKFFDDLHKNPLYAFRWSAGAIPEACAAVHAWETGLLFLEDKANLGPGPFLEALGELGQYADEQLRRVIQGRSWNQNSTNPWSNLTDVGQVNGEVEAWEEIRQFAEWAAARMPKVDREPSEEARP